MGTYTAVLVLGRELVVIPDHIVKQIFGYIHQCMHALRMEEANSMALRMCIVSDICAVCVYSSITSGSVWKDPPTKTSSEQTSKDNDDTDLKLQYGLNEANAAWIQVVRKDEKSVSRLVNVIVDIASDKAKKALRTDQSLLDSLWDDLEVVLFSQAMNQFEPYYQLMTIKGCLLGDMASNRADQYALYDNFKGVIPKDFSVLSVKDKSGLLWEQAKRRRVEWDKVNVASIQIGHGLTAQSGINWPHHSWAGAVSMFVPPLGYPTPDKADQISDSDTVWIMFAVQYSQGSKSAVRFSFYYDHEINQWLPYSLLVSGSAGMAPLPLL